MGLDLIPSDIKGKYEIHEWKHACAILKNDFPDEWNDLLAMLRAFTLRKSWLVSRGGNKTKLAVWVDNFLGERGWKEKQFDTVVQVDDVEMKSPTHKVDAYKNKVAIELEWNNKDPFFDRDLVTTQVVGFEA